MTFWSVAEGQTSRGGSILVIPPGIMGGTVFRRASVFFTGFVKWPLNESHTKIDFCFISPPTLDQREFSQSLTRASSIQPFSWHLTSTLLGNLTFFGRVFLLKTTYGGSFDPSPLHASITVKWSFSCPVVMIGTVLIPEAETVVFDAMCCGVWSAFPIVLRSKSYHWRIVKMDRWKLTSLSSKSSGSFWATVVVQRMEKLCGQGTCNTSSEMPWTCHPLFPCHGQEP